jgi:hypothetical protein
MAGRNFRRRIGRHEHAPSVTAGIGPNAILILEQSGNPPLFFLKHVSLDLRISCSYYPVKQTNSISGVVVWKCSFNAR